MPSLVILTDPASIRFLKYRADEQTDGGKKPNPPRLPLAWVKLNWPRGLSTRRIASA